MGIGFLVPAFLAGLAAIAIPLFVHLRHKEKDKPYKFPSLMFLAQLPTRTSQRQRITDWPLLLLRALAVALLVAAFARPVFTRQSMVNSDMRAKAVVILLDRSMSMGHASVWPAALDSAKQIIAKLSSRDRVGIVFFDDAAEVAQRLTDDKSAASAVLSRAKPMPRGTRFAPAIRTARQMLLDAPYSAAEIVLISDLQRAGTSGIAGIDLPAGVQLRGVNVGANDRGNSAVRAVEASRISDGTKTMLAVKARVSSRALSTARTVTATLTLNGREAGTRTVSLPMSGETVVTFAPVAAASGEVTGTVSLDADALAADDKFFFVVPREDALRVTLVLPDDATNGETLFLDRALSIGRTPEIRLERTSVASLNPNLLQHSAVVLLWDVAPTTNGATQLETYVTNGGGVIVAAGRRLGARSSASRIIPARVTGMADRLPDRGGTLTQLHLEHALFAPFRATPDALGGARFLRYPRLDASAGTEVLARFDDALPAIIERKLGSGRIVMVAAPLDAQNGDLPLQPAFLPFVRQLVLHTSGRDAVPLWRTTAESWSVPESLKDPVVRAPDDALLRPRRDSLGSAVPLADAGLYSAYAGAATGAPAAFAAVNVPPSESDLAAIDPKELLLGVRESERATVTSGAPPTTDELERRQNAWRWLMIVVALALVSETFMSTRGWRAVARRYRPASPERSES